MATYLSIDPALIDQALMGQLEWGEGFDYKAERSRS